MVAMIGITNLSSFNGYRLYVDGVEPSLCIHG